MAGRAGWSLRRVVMALVAAEVLAAAGLVAAHVVTAGRTTGAATGPASAPVASARSQSAHGKRPQATPSGLPALAPRPVPGLVQGAGFAAVGPVSCDTDLPLTASPASGYNFLCRQGGIPVTWYKSRLAFYVTGLTEVQTAAFDAAVAQWAAASRYQVTYTSTARNADVTVTAAPLGDSQVGFVEDGYTTVSYRCTPVCAYSGARVELSTTAALAPTDWLSTILHELGHVAGLNHVSLPGEAMYPYLTAEPPQRYAAGDLQGLLILAAERGA